jgi:hypothetical protein
MESFIDDELTHFEMVMRTWLCEIETNPVTSPIYWRNRIFALMRSNHLSPQQLRRVHALLAIIARFDEHCAFTAA